MHQPTAAAAAPTRRRRTRRVATIAAAAVAVLVGVAGAYFTNEKTVGNNEVASGSINASYEGLPLTFGGNPLFPTDPDNPQSKVTDDFVLKNDNGVAVTYLLSAACASTCAPADSAQFDNLYYALYRVATGALGDQREASPVSQGRLADLSDTDVGDVAAKAIQKYSMDVWLADTGTEQPQNQRTTFDLTVAARTPTTATSTAGA